MAWIQPKTNWVDGDYFNLDPDYNRIKGNIEYLITLSEEMYSEHTSPELGTYDTTGYPTFKFFADIVNATNAMLTYCYRPNGAESMRKLDGNSIVWNAAELNAIENNHLLLYEAFHLQKSSLRRLQITLGGIKIGT